MDLPSLIATSKILDNITIKFNPSSFTVDKEIIHEGEMYQFLKVLLPPYSSRTSIKELEPAHLQAKTGTHQSLTLTCQYIRNNWKPNPTLIGCQIYDLYQDGLLNSAAHFRYFNCNPCYNVIAVLSTQVPKSGPRWGLVTTCSSYFKFLELTLESQVKIRILC
ncbi:hypothetical protein B0H10DRAFT_1944835 [Mycena sp. CBHHK59/15]|nr:hypothetical protein B0H10DRAFT_1956457 [Mycena sp. CBHHK59/15]KAJ6622233.1 hypothetical protein B0H10DRAFT_1944835 [Mycena sp. CBHHK59/15]